MINQKHINLIDLNQLTDFEKIILVTGKKSFKKNDSARLILEKFNKKTVHIKKDNSPTEISYIKKIINENDIKKINCLVAIGGGNVIDFAKSLIYFTDSKAQYFLAIPTTCGSGSESTNFFVVYENNLKKSLKSEYILPSFILLNYKNLLGLNKKTLISSYIDALSQSIESFWSINSTQKSKLISLKALEYLILAKDDLTDYQSKSLNYAQMGSNLAGKAINISKTTAPHAFSYYFNKHSIPHGFAVNITTTFFMKFIYDNGSTKLKKDLDDLSNSLIKKDFIHFIIFYSDILKSLGNRSIKEFKKIKNFNFENFYSSVNKERLKNTPVKISKKSLKNYLDTL